MSTTSPFSSFSIPEPWAQQCHTNILAIINATNTHLAFAQIYDGTQTESAALGMSDVESCLDFKLPQNVTTNATGFAQAWLDGQNERIKDRHVNASAAEKAVQFLSTGEPDTHKVALLIHCFVKPILHDCMRKFIMECENDGLSIGGDKFQQKKRGKASAIEAIQEWGEEFIFGGLLLHGNSTILEVQPLHMPKFQIPYEQAWRTTHLPFQCSRGSQSVCPSENDDPHLQKYMDERQNID